MIIFTYIIENTDNIDIQKYISWVVLFLKVSYPQLT